MRTYTAYERAVNGPRGRNLRTGKITQFLRRNLFTVELDNGERLTAVMPSNLLHVAVNARHGLRTLFIAVAVEARKPPRMARIVAAHESGLTGM